MSDDESPISKRRVYDLPTDLVDRITAFQRDKKLPSEVEAVRRLLDEALLHRDSAMSLLNRFSKRLKVDGMPASVAKDILVGHPLIEEIGFPDLSSVTFQMKGFGKFSIDDRGTAHQYEHGAWSKVEYSYFDDEIPF